MTEAQTKNDSLSVKISNHSKQSKNTKIKNKYNLFTRIQYYCTTKNNIGTYFSYTIEQVFVTKNILKLLPYRELSFIPIYIQLYKHAHDLYKYFFNIFLKYAYLRWRKMNIHSAVRYVLKYVNCLSISPCHHNFTKIALKKYGNNKITRKQYKHIANMTKSVT